MITLRKVGKRTLGSYLAFYPFAEDQPSLKLRRGKLNRTADTRIFSNQPGQARKLPIFDCCNRCIAKFRA